MTYSKSNKRERTYSKSSKTVWFFGQSKMFHVWQYNTMGLFDFVCVVVCVIEWKEVLLCVY